MSRVKALPIEEILPKEKLEKLRGLSALAVYVVRREGEEAVVYVEYSTPHRRVRKEVFRSRDHSEAIRYALNRSPNTILEGEFKIGKTIKVKGGVISGAKPLEFPEED